MRCGLAVSDVEASGDPWSVALLPSGSMSSEASSLSAPSRLSPGNDSPASQAAIMVEGAGERRDLFVGVS